MVPIKQTNLNHLLLAVDPVLIGWLCNLEAVVIYNISIKYGFNPDSLPSLWAWDYRNIPKNKEGITYGETRRCFCHRRPFATLVTHRNTHTYTQTEVGVKSVLGKARACGYLRCQAPGSTDSGSFCLFLFLPSFPLSTHFPLSLPAGSSSHTQTLTMPYLSVVC